MIEGFWILDSGFLSKYLNQSNVFQNPATRIQHPFSSSHLKSLRRRALQIFFKIKRHIPAFQQASFGNGWKNIFISLDQIHEHSPEHMGTIELVRMSDSGGSNQFNKAFHCILVEIGYTLFLIA